MVALELMTTRGMLPSEVMFRFLTPTKLASRLLVSEMIACQCVGFVRKINEDSARSFTGSMGLTIACASDSVSVPAAALDSISASLIKAPAVASFHPG